MPIKELDVSESEESPRKTTTGVYAVNWSIVQTQNYSDKFKKISDNTVVSDSIETRAKWALNNRKDKDTEELYAVSLDDGREISRITDQHFRFGVKRTDKFIKEVNSADDEGERILFIHNHPKGYPPSITDINNLLDNKNVAGITVGHDGSVYFYTRPDRVIDEIDFMVQMRHNKEFTKITCMEKSLESLSKDYGFEVRKL